MKIKLNGKIPGCTLQLKVRFISVILLEKFFSKTVFGFGGLNKMLKIKCVVFMYTLYCFKEDLKQHIGIEKTTK